MRAFVLSLLAVSCVATLMVAAPKPASAEPKVLPMAQDQTAGKVEQVGYWRRRYVYRPYRHSTFIVLTTIDRTAITDHITDPTIATGMATPITIAPTTTVRALASGLASEPEDDEGTGGLASTDFLEI
jgi:hypothetical protein